MFPGCMIRRHDCMIATKYQLYMVSPYTYLDCGFACIFDSPLSEPKASKYDEDDLM